MSYLLAWETVTRGGSIAAVDYSGELRATYTIPDDRGGAELIPRAQEMIANHGTPSHLACAHGPGSFTGLRISVIAARTLAWLESLPIYAVCSLEALCYAAGPGHWWPTMSLKRDTTFHARMTLDEQHRLTIHEPVQAILDSQQCTWADHCAGAQLIGAVHPVNDLPITTFKAQTLRARYPTVPCGPAVSVDAVAIAKAALSPGRTTISWQQLLPAYHQASAPEIQRQQQQQQQQAQAHYHAPGPLP